MKFSPCLLPADAALLVEQFVPFLAQLERPDLSPEERAEIAAKARSWIVETSSFLKLYGAQGRPDESKPNGAVRVSAESPDAPLARTVGGAVRTPPIHPGPQRTPPVVSPGPKKPCGCDDKVPPVHPGARPEIGIRQRIQERAQARFRKWLLGDAKKGIER